MHRSTDHVRRRFIGEGARLALLVGAMVALQWSAAQPSPRFYVNSVFVPAVGKVLVFGGIIDGDGPPGVPIHPVDLVWWWDPSNGSWTQGDLGGSNVPAVSQLAVHEPSGHVMVYGTHGRASLGETWFFDPLKSDPLSSDPLASGWERVEMRGINIPPTGLGPGLVYYPPTDTFVMFGHNSGAMSPRVWHFDMGERTWTRVDTTDPPYGRNYVSFAFDPVSELVVMYGMRAGDNHAHLYDPRSSSWSVGGAGPDSEIEDAYSKMVYDFDSGKLVRYGGTGEFAAAPWVYDAATAAWHELEVTGPVPEQRRSHAMASVPGVGVVVFGGQLGASLEPLADPLTAEVWVLNVNQGTWELR